jgi:hypothetical protein
MSRSYISSLPSASMACSGTALLFLKSLKAREVQVLTVASVKLTVFWAIIALIMEAVSTSEKLVNFYETTLHNIPEDSHLLSLSYSQNPTIGLYPEQVQSSPYTHRLFF